MQQQWLNSSVTCVQSSLINRTNTFNVSPLTENTMQSQVKSCNHLKIELSQGVYKSSLTNFQNSFNKFPVVFFTLIEPPLSITIIRTYEMASHTINAYTSINFEVFLYEHVTISSGQRSSLCHPSYFINKNDETTFSNTQREITAVLNTLNRVRISVLL